MTVWESAASNHYFAMRDKNTLINVQPNNLPTTTTITNHSTLQSTLQGNQLIKCLSEIATNAKLFNNLNHSLISIGQLCDDNCTVILTKKNLKVIKNNSLTLMGTRSATGDGLWDIPILQNEASQKNGEPTAIKNKITYPTLTPSSLNIILRTDKRASDLAAYLHAACFSPVKQTFLNAIKNFFSHMAWLNAFPYPKASCSPTINHTRTYKTRKT